MKFLIITHVEHIKQNDTYFAYAPYVREMNIWLKHVDEVLIVAPLCNGKKSIIDESYIHSKLNFNNIPVIAFTSILNAIVSVVKIPVILYKLFIACYRADHIHLRCPGNIGLLGCFVQILFSKKNKTAKYAGNWDPNSKQPLSYRLQKWILSNTFLTKNMSVLVYGNWHNQTKNIKSFFTASFKDNDRVETIIKDYSKTLNFIFIGSLVPGKRPLLTIQIIENLYKIGLNAVLDIYGEGELKNDLMQYVSENNLSEIVRFHGNVNKEALKKVYINSHFVLLPSKSEGWPKALAEGMFFGVIPIATDISCIKWMTDNERRGILIKPELNSAANKIIKTIKNGNLEAMSVASQQWAQKYTLDKFEQEIVKLL